MAGQIIVPLSGSDQIEDILPYLERVAQPWSKDCFSHSRKSQGLWKVDRAVAGDPYRIVFQSFYRLRRRGVRQKPNTFSRGADFSALQ